MVGTQMQDVFRADTRAAIVEQVRDGTLLRVRLLLDEHTHQFINLQIAGAKSPRASNGRDGDTSGAEPLGEDVSERRVWTWSLSLTLLGEVLCRGQTAAAADQGSASFGAGYAGRFALPSGSYACSCVR